MNALSSRRGRRLTVLLCAVCLAVAAWCGGTLINNWDALWGDFYSAAAFPPLNTYDQQAYEAIRLRLRRDQWGEPLTYLEQEQLQILEESLDRENTNYRFQIRSRDGALLWGNTAESDLEGALCQASGEVSISAGETLEEEDQLFWSDSGATQLLEVYTGTDYLTFDPSQGGEPWSVYGYTYQDETWSYDPDRDSRIHNVLLVIRSGVVEPLTCEDLFTQARQDYQQLQGWLLPLALTFLLSAAGTGLLARRLWRSSTTAGWQEKAPYDLFLLAAAALLQCLLLAGEPIAYVGSQEGWSIQAVVGMGLLSLLAALLGVDVYLSTAVRVRTGGLWHGTLLCRILSAVRRWAAGFGLRWPLEKRMVRLFLLYLVGTLLTGFTIFLIPVYQGLVLWYLCRWARGWAAIQRATAAILAGETDVSLDTAGMPRSLRPHAQALNDLSQAISHAVEERLKSERFRTELITNVSHDLKTPLTSIMNYVDLLKKTGVEDPTALSYIEVLERKSRRLKKLTEDLVEASKASSGTLPVHLETLDFVQLLRQALGEYEEKLVQSRLEPVLDTPEEPCLILADGRHLWRVVDNLLGNCCKYALPGTRIYLCLIRRAEGTELVVKNISKAPLNVPPQQLMERFVRGDSARSSEGSGLGLSIAQSLTELQGGSFDLEIDGDLFKAKVWLPTPPAPPSQA